VTTRAATLAALLAVLGRPTWWVLALAGFLARGGIVLFVLAIVILPSPLALSNVLSPLLVPIIFGGVSAELALAIVAAILSVLAMIAAGALVGAATEIALIEDGRAAAPDEGIPAASRAPLPGRWRTFRVAAARLVAHLPLLVVASLATIQIVNVTYAELIRPEDISTPLPLRILGGAALPIAAIVLTLVLGEIAGGWAARAIVLDGRSVLRAVTAGFDDLVERPRSTLLPALLTTAVLALDLAAVLAIVDLAWTLARTRLADIPPAPVETGLALASFAATWFLALLVTGLIDAWRSVAMTFEAERRAAATRPAGTGIAGPSGPDSAGVGGTFGGSPDRRPGDWSAGPEGGSL